jgi:hypothetical protein
VQYILERGYRIGRCDQKNSCVSLSPCALFESGAAVHFSETRTHMRTTEESGLSYCTMTFITMMFSACDEALERQSFHLSARVQRGWKRKQWVRWS